MAGNRKGQALRIEVGITALVLLMVDGAGAATPISACTTISAPGEYVLTQNIINSNASTCISITSSNVIFDGAGYTIDGIDTYSYGVYVYNYDTTLTDITVKNLVATDWYDAILYQNTADGHILGNTANSNNAGIFLWDSSNNILSNNIANMNNHTGIYLWTSSNSNTLTGNTANSNFWHGIAVQNYSDHNTLSSNIAMNNVNNGIELYISRNNTLRNNNASYNNRGIHLDSFNENNLLSNNIVSNNNKEGITLTNSSNNNIYNNYFNNTKNFGISNSVNNWNSTKTSGTNIVSGSYLGGNFWANPDGTGFSQTCADADRDGICDSPYTLATDNIDYLPLASNSGTPSPTATLTPTATVTPTRTATPTPSPTPTPPPTPSAVGVGVLFIDKTDLIGDVNDSSIDITRVRGYKNGNIYSFEISLRGAVIFSHRSYQILIDGNSTSHPDYSISTWNNSEVRIWDFREYPSKSVLLKYGMAELNGNKITLTGDFSGIDLSNNSFKVRNDLSSSYPPYDVIETDRLKLDIIIPILAPTPTPTATSIVTPTPAVTPTPTPSPSPTTGGDIISRYAGSDGIVQKSEAVQAVMDYFSGIITRQEAISVVMAYFNG